MPVHVDFQAFGIDGLRPDNRLVPILHQCRYLNRVLAPLRHAGYPVSVQQAVVQLAAAPQQVHRKHRRACQLHELGGHRQLCHHLREPRRYSSRLARRGVVRIGERSVYVAIGPMSQAPRFHPKLHVRHQGPVCRHRDADPPHREPLPRGRRLAARAAAAAGLAVEDAGYPGKSQITKAELLESIVRLEKHLPDDGSSEPLRVEALQQEGPRQVVRILRVQRKLRLPPALAQHPQHARQVRQRHRRLRVCGRDGCAADAAGRLVEGDAHELALGCVSRDVHDAEISQSLVGARHDLRPPRQLVLGRIRLFLPILSSHSASLDHILPLLQRAGVAGPAAVPLLSVLEWVRLRYLEEAPVDAVAAITTSKALLVEGRAVDAHERLAAQCLVAHATAGLAANAQVAGAVVGAEMRPVDLPPAAAASEAFRVEGLPPGAHGLAAHRRPALRAALKRVRSLVACLA
mmetsp:Transcript_71593/g.205416  ORF Transcript_71593/g.205416 Transcript_71593/m.205416 type:complete len:461 (-) Transcript_71593:468-1850(-)